MRGEGPYADLIANRFKLAVKKLGLDGPRPRLDTTAFSVPGRAEQMTLL